jgi:putative spermidine/putrescine transport system permease protein
MSLATRSALLALAGGVTLFLIVPLIIAVPLSLSSVARISFPPPGLSWQWYEELLGDGLSGSVWTRSALQSVQVGLLTSVLSVSLGGLAAVPIARATFKGKSLIETSLLLPLVLPSVVLASGLLFLFLDTGMLGSTMGLVLAHTMLATPYVMLIIAAALRGFDERLEWAAMSLGASRARTWRTITIPLIRPAILVAAFFAFLTSFDELIISMFVGDNRNPTLPRLLWGFVTSETTPVIAAVSTALFALSIAFVAVMAVLTRSRS